MTFRIVGRRARRPGPELREMSFPVPPGSWRRTCRCNAAGHRSAWSWFLAAWRSRGAWPRSVAQQGDALPHADPPFEGVADRTLAGSKPDFPQPVTAPPGAPNVLLVLVDDAGFGNPSTFGGPCQTPTLTKLAGRGPALQPLPRHGAVLADAGRAALGAEPSRRRLRLDRRVRRRLAGLQRAPGPRAPRHRQDPPGQRLLHGRVRQVAPHARQTSRARPGRSTAGRTAWASTTSGASSAARAASTTRS